MKKHIQKATDTFMDDITRNAETPATSHLLKTHENTKLSEEKSENFHSVVASFMFFFEEVQVRHTNFSGFPTGSEKSKMPKSKKVK